MNWVKIDEVSKVEFFVENLRIQECSRITNENSTMSNRNSNLGVVVYLKVPHFEKCYISAKTAYLKNENKISKNDGNLDIKLSNFRLF